MSRSLRNYLNSDASCPQRHAGQEQSEKPHGASMERINQDRVSGEIPRAQCTPRSSITGLSNRNGGYQSETASWPGTIGAVRGNLPKYARIPIPAKIPRKTTSFTTFVVWFLGSHSHSNPSTG
jgi:hypothetical protein